MTIPKRRSYKMYILLFIAVCTAFSSVLISLGGALAQAVTSPEASRSDKSTSQNQSTSRRDDRNNSRNNNNNNNETDTKSHTVVTNPPQPQNSPQVTQKANTVTVKSAKVAQQPQTPSVAVAATTVPVVVVTEAPQIPDTSASAVQLAANQSQHSTQPSVYTSTKITGFERDQLYRASYIVAAMGGSLYLMSFAKLASQAYRSVIPERRTTITQ